MLRRFAVFTLVLAALAAGASAEACWHRWGCYRGCGGGYGGYGSYGWGGYPYYSMYRGFGYPGYGYGMGYYPGFSSLYMGYGGMIGGFAANSPAIVGSSGPGPYAATRPLTVSVASAPAVRSPSFASAPLGGRSAPIASSVAALKPTSDVAARALAVQQLLGLKDLHPVNLMPRATVAARPATGPTARSAAAPTARTEMVDRLVARLSTSEGRRKAERLMAEGNELFRSQNFHSALQKYKQATSAAPDLAEAHWRQGHALVATHNYDLAAKSFKRAVALADDLSRGGFRLDDLYGAAMRTKAVHLDSLAQWAMDRGNVSADPYFLIGLFLQYDGQLARAEKFFEKASDIAGISGGHIAVFLAPTVEAAPATRRAPAITGASGPAVSTPAVSTSIVPISLSREI